MAYQKDKQVEPGIWRLPDGNYLAEINYTDPQTGKRTRERKTTNRLDLAQNWRLTRKADALRGEIQGKKDRLQPVVFSTFAKEYLEQWSKVKKKESSAVRDQTSINRLNETFSKKLLSEITRRDVEKYLGTRKAAGRTPATMNRELCCLKNMLRKAVDWNYLKDNPAWGVKQQRENPPEFTFLAEAEIDALLDHCAEHLAVFFTLAVYTGLRRGELFKLEWKDVADEKGRLKEFITVRDSKNGDTRHVPMNRTVREALINHPKRIANRQVCPLLFSSPEGNPITDVKKGFAGALKRSGVDRHVRFHDLRHTFASHLIMKGVDLRTVAKLMGHRDIKMTMRYAHLAPDHLQAAVDALEVRLDPTQDKQGTDG
jgi:site-specific recombinase XerD